MPRLFALLLLVLYVATAAAANPAGIVFGYECKQVDPKHIGFSCSVRDNRMLIRIHRHYAEGKEKELQSYEFNKLVLRYFDLGGGGFDIVSDDWPKEKMRMCTPSSSRVNYVCNDCTWHEEDGGGKTCR